jgi:hypothetical protein
VSAAASSSAQPPDLLRPPWAGRRSRGRAGRRPAWGEEEGGLPWGGGRGGWGGRGAQGAPARAGGRGRRGATAAPCVSLPVGEVALEHRQSARPFLQSSELGLPHAPTHPQASLAPTLVPNGGRVAHSLAGEGVGESQFRRGDIHCDTLYMCTSCFSV